MWPEARITEPTTGARNSPPVAMIRGRIRRTPVAAVSTIGSIGEMWLAARISGPRRSSSGRSPTTSRRPTSATSTRATLCRTIHSRGGFQV
jgi:hypothetical protein